MYEEEVKTGEAVDNEEFHDITLTCRDCGKEFVFTAGEQQFYKEKGFLNQPKTCKACRIAKKNGGKPATERQYYTATCAACGGEAKLTFQPTDDRPVYCSACFEAKKNANN
ncbi:MAG: zinc-ribbon domain containing protein [Clostridia bacterium]|nr:zinc-ribbon domain containing protein [Clostridia bacterium]MDY3785303.1 zinc-ribbon domain containing protein [Eubacteriales bacterium]